VNVGGPLALTCAEATSCTASGGPGSAVTCLGDRSCSIAVAGGSVQCRNELGTTCQVTCEGRCEVTCAGRGTCPQTCLAGPLLRCGNNLSTCGLCPDGGTGLGPDAGPDLPSTPWNLAVGCTTGPGVAPWVLLAVALSLAFRPRRR
jgi:MYXO-CTERM domain-containing protein